MIMSIIPAPIPIAACMLRFFNGTDTLWFVLPPVSFIGHFILSFFNKSHSLMVEIKVMPLLS